MTPTADELLAILDQDGRDPFLTACFGRPVIRVAIRQPDPAHPLRGHLVVTFETFRANGRPSTRPDQLKLPLARMLTRTRATRNRLRTTLWLKGMGAGNGGVRWRIPVAWVHSDHPDPSRRRTYGDEQVLEAFREALLDAAFEQARERKTA